MPQRYPQLLTQPLFSHFRYALHLLFVHPPPQNLSSCSSPQQICHAERSCSRHFVSNAVEGPAVAFVFLFVILILPTLSAMDSYCGPYILRCLRRLSTDCRASELASDRLWQL